MRASLGREYELWTLLSQRPEDRERYGMSETYGQSALLVETTDQGETCINAEVFDHDSGVSLVVSQPVKKTLLGRWKETGPARLAGAAEPLPVILRGPALRYNLEPLLLEERRRLLAALQSRSIPHLTCFAEVFIASEDKVRVTAIDGWPNS